MEDTIHDDYLFINEFDHIERKSNRPLHTSSKSEEFQYVLRDIELDENVDIANFARFNENLDERIPDYEMNDRMCICGQHINNLFIIKNRVSGNTYVVGSECIKKLSEHDYNRIFKSKCNNCRSIIMEKRSRVCKAGFCSKYCFDLFKIGNWTVLFGKYKGRLWNEVDKNYYWWMKYESSITIPPRVELYLSEKYRI